jgi:phenylalanyl-tRNA synthetase beta subunit
MAEIVDAGGLAIGRMGEIHPERLESYGLRHAVAVMEVSLERLLAS